MMPAGRTIAGRLAARAMLLTRPNYATIRGAATTGSITQGDEEWLDVSQFADIAAWIEVMELTQPTSGLLLLQLESSPTGDESTFVPVIGPLPLGTTFAPAVFTTASAGNTPLAKFLRWKLVSTGSSLWDVTMRIRIMGNRTQRFAPTQLGNCVYWIRPDCGLTFSGATITKWANRSGSDPNKNLTTQSATGPSCNFLDPSFNSTPTVLFTAASSQYMTSGSWATQDNQPNTFVVVGKRSSSASQMDAMDGATNGFGQVVAGSAGASCSIFAGSTLTGGGDWTTPRMVLAEFNGTSGAIWYNTLTSASASGAVGSAGFDALSLASHNPAFGASNFWDGQIAELIGFSGLLSAAQKALLRTYLNNRYGLAIS